MTALVLVTLFMSASMAGAQHYFLEQAADGVILIHQDNALGFALSGDAPGFPITISKKGSYRLSSNITVPDANTTAIEITADNVSLDLNGFTISGPVVCPDPVVTPCASPNVLVAGVRSTGVDTTVRNGIITGMGGRGIFLQNEGGRVEGVFVANNLSNGIEVTRSAIVLHSTARRNAGVGISVPTGSLAIANVAFLNAGGGIFGNVTVGVGQNVAGGNSFFNIGTVQQTDGNVCGSALC
jgi:hypothetical protein